MARNYKRYNLNPNYNDIHQIFDDLEKLLDFCRIRLLPFDESFLYNRNSEVWNRYYNHTQKQLRAEGKLPKRTPYQKK